MESSVPSGWYPDPNGFECDRFWDGQNWTEQTRPKQNLLNANPPQPQLKKTGLDSTEKALLIGIGVLVLLVAIISGGY